MKKLEVTTETSPAATASSLSDAKKVEKKGKKGEKKGVAGKSTTPGNAASRPRSRKFTGEHF